MRRRLLAAIASAAAAALVLTVHPPEPVLGRWRDVESARAPVSAAPPGAPTGVVCVQGLLGLTVSWSHPPVPPVAPDYRVSVWHNGVQQGIERVVPGDERQIAVSTLLSDLLGNRIYEVRIVGAAGSWRSPVVRQNVRAGLAGILPQCVA